MTQRYVLAKTTMWVGLIASLFSSGCATCCNTGGCEPVGSLIPHLAARTRCASGCGDVYLGEWFTDPPGCDPCDRCGNYVGPVGYCGPSWRELWGIRYEGGCADGACGGCSACHAESHDHVVDEGHGAYYGPEYPQYETSPGAHHGHGATQYPPQRARTLPPPQPPTPNPANADATAPEDLPPLPTPEMMPIPEPAQPAPPLRDEVPQGGPMETRLPAAYRAAAPPQRSPFSRRRR